MPKRIVISALSDLITDQRVNRVALTLHRAGCEVLLIGRRGTAGVLNAPFPARHIRLWFRKGVAFYLEFNLRLLFVLLFVRADVLLSNDTDTLIPNYLVSRWRKKRLVFDAHELFPEVPELARRPLKKRCWEGVENWIFPRLQTAYTVSASIAEHYRRKYGIAMHVIRNVPYRRDRHATLPVLPSDGRKIILYQGALNVGRGLEWVIEAMPLVENARLVVIGDGDIADRLRQQVRERGLTDRVEFLGRIACDDLFSYTSTADLGLCLLEQVGLSYYYALPNRIFDFIQAGVPILATDFPEIAAVVGTHHTGRLIDHYEPDYLAGVINEMLATGKAAQAAHFAALAEQFCWENEEKKLLEIV